MAAAQSRRTSPYSEALRWHVISR